MANGNSISAMPSIALGLLALPISVVLMTADAMACSCAAPATPAKALSRSSAAFAGRVIDIDRPFLDRLGLTASGLHDVAFAVVKAWKGTTSEQIVIRTRLSGEACGYRFEIGETYLVYVSDDPDRLTGICTGTRPTEGAEADMRALDRLLVPPEE